MSKSDENPLVRHGGLSYLELPAAVPSRSAAFYEKVLGWKIDVRTADDQRFSVGDGLLIGRFVKGRAASREPGLVPMFYVRGLDAAVTRAAEHGGEIVEAPYAEGDVRVARVRDPAGNLLGLWQFASG
jgi:predicted enzyme related to lactoylglutathione lyase